MTCAICIITLHALEASVTDHCKYNGIMNFFPVSHSMFAKINTIDTNSYIPALNLCIRHASKFVSVFVHIAIRL